MSKRKRMSRHPPMRSLTASPYTSDPVLTDAVKLSDHVTSDPASEDGHIHELAGEEDDGDEDIVTGDTHDFERGSDRQKSPTTVVSGRCDGFLTSEQSSVELSSELQLDDLPAAITHTDLACSALHCHATFATPRHYVRHVLLEHRGACEKGVIGSGTLMCPLCGQEPRGLAALENHLLEHTAYRPFSCAECGQRQASGWAVQQHRALCPGPAGAGASKRRRVSNSDQPSSTTLCCETCGERMDSLAQLVAHNYSRHGANRVTDEDGLQCDKCAFTTNSEELMQQHEAQHKCSEWIRRACQAGPLAGPMSTGAAPVSADLADIRSILSVTRTPAVCGTVDSSGDHSPPPAHCAAPLLRTSPLFAGKDCGERLLPSLLAASVAPTCNGAVEEDAEDPSFEVIRAMKAKGEFPCRLCGQVFPNLRAMKGHNRVHMASAPYACNVCVFSSGDKATLVRHMKQHNGERPYECRLCRFAFTTKANCERHLKNRHQLRTRDQLNDSMLVHAAAEAGQLCPPAAVSIGSCLAPAAKLTPTFCSVCRLDLKQVRAYREHVRSEHGVQVVEAESDSGGFQCTVCDLLFVELTAAVQHVCSHQQHQPLSDSPPTMVSMALKTGAQALAAPRRGSVSPLASPAASTSSVSLGNHATESVVMDTLEEAPLDLSVRDRRPAEAQPPRPVNENAVAAAAAAMMGSPLGLYMRYGAPVPLFVMSSVLSDQRDLLARYSSASNFALPLPAAELFTCPQQPSDGTASQDPPPGIEVTGRDLALPLLAAGGTMESPTEVQQKPKQRRYRTQRPFSCCYCEARFTLSTNMDRHIKNHHPDKWERKARGGRRVTSGASTPASSVPIPAVTAVSTSTASTSCGSPAAATEAVSGPADSTNGCVSDDDAPLVIDEQSAAPARCEDLASVARLVDSARTHNFQQYFEQASDGGASGSSGAEDLESSTSAAGSERRRSAYSAAPNKIACRVCRRQFPWSSSLRRHELTHSGQKPFSCPRCSVHFTTKSNCDRHMVRKHGGPASSASSPPSPSSLSPALRRSGSFWCPGCGDTFSQLATARDHVQLEHEQLCDQLSGWTASEGPAVDDEAADQDKVLCVVCCTAYEDIDTLSSHIHVRHLPTHTETITASYQDSISSPTQQPERAKKREHLNDISARLSASLLKQRTLVNGHTP